MIAAGVGCRAGCPPADIIEALTRAVELEGLVLEDVQALFSVEAKRAEAGLLDAAELLGKRLVLLPHAALAAQAGGTLTRSAAVAARFALPSVAETAALAGAVELAGEVPFAGHVACASNGGTRARLLAPRQVAGGAACALARADRGEEAGV
jgi:cobalt-precorrin 5A hydrolase